MRVFKTVAAIAFVSATGAAQAVYAGRTAAEWLAILRRTDGLPKPLLVADHGPTLTETLRALGTIAPDTDEVVVAIVDAPSRRLTRPQRHEFVAALARIGPKSRMALIASNSLLLIEPKARGILGPDPRFDRLVEQHFADPIRRDRTLRAGDYAHLFVHAIEDPTHRPKALQLLSAHQNAPAGAVPVLLRWAHADDATVASLAHAVILRLSAPGHRVAVGMMLAGRDPSLPLTLDEQAPWFQELLAHLNDADGEAVDRLQRELVRRRDRAGEVADHPPDQSLDQVRAQLRAMEFGTLGNTLSTLRQHWPGDPAAVPELKAIVAAYDENYGAVDSPKYDDARTAAELLSRMGEPGRLAIRDLLLAGTEHRRPLGPAVYRNGLDRYLTFDELRSVLDGEADSTLASIFVSSPVEMVETLLREQAPDRERWSANALYAMSKHRDRPPTFIDELAEFLDDPRPTIAKAAQLALAEVGPMALPKILPRLAPDQPAELHRQAFGVLRRMGKEALGASAALIDLARERPIYRLDATQILAQCGDRSKRSTTFLIESLHSDDWAVRRAAAVALGEAGDAGAIEPLQPLRRDPDHAVREAVARSLAQLTPPSPPPERSIDELVATLDAEVPLERGTALVELMERGDEGRLAAWNSVGALTPDTEITDAVRERVLYLYYDALTRPGDPHRQAMQAAFDVIVGQPR